MCVKRILPSIDYIVVAGVKLLERKSMRIAKCLLRLALGACALIAVTASAQSYPSRPVRLLLGHMNSNAVAPALFPRLPYNPARVASLPGQRR